MNNSNQGQENKKAASRGICRITGGEPCAELRRGHNNSIGGVYGSNSRRL